MTLLGVDLSNHDWGRGPVDVASMVRAGVVFVTHKATDGLRFYKDPFHAEAQRRFRAAGVVLPGAYHVLWPADPAGQADWFLAELDSDCPWWRLGPFMLVADAEPFGYNGRAPNKSEISAFCDRIRAQSGRPVVVYAPKWAYGDSLTGLDCPLWASAYGTNQAGWFSALYPGDNDPRWAGYSGQTPAILQYGSRTTVGSQPTVDANAYRGGIADLLTLTGHGGDDAMKTILIRRTGTDPVYLSNGMGRWWIPNGDVLRDVQWVGGPGPLTGTLVDATIHDVDDLDAFGPLIGNDPVDVDVHALADLLVQRLGPGLATIIAAGTRQAMDGATIHTAQP